MAALGRGLSAASRAASAVAESAASAAAYASALVVERPRTVSRVVDLVAYTLPGEWPRLVAVALCCAAVPLGALMLVGVSSASVWVLWLAVSLSLSMLQQVWAVWQYSRIMMSFVGIGLLKSCVVVSKTWNWLRMSAAPGAAGAKARRKAVTSAASYGEYTEAVRALAAAGDAPLGQAWAADDAALPAAPLLRATLADLVAAREAGDSSQLRFLLSGVLKRNHQGTEDEELYYRTGLVETHGAVEAYRAEVVRCLHALADDKNTPPAERLRFFRRQRQALGQTALCLSGGGALTMYHAGVLRALLESGALSRIKVVSGTSGGSIMAAMVASRTEAELMEFVLQDTVSTDFRKDGAQGRAGISWFPPLHEQLLNFARHRRLITPESFMKTCKW